MASTFTVVFDSCVLFSSSLRDLLMQLSTTGLFRPRWSLDIHKEWKRALLEARSDITSEMVERTQRRMDLVAPDCLVTGYERFIDSLALPDPKDRHVLAAAIRARADLIVTLNLKHFPNAIVNPFGIDVQHPDRFVRHLLDLHPGLVVDAVRRLRARLSKPPLSSQQYLECLERQGLLASVAELRRYADSV